MVTFLTFFLGLTAGSHPVEVAVGRAVAAVELHLDGRVLGRLEEAPWRFDCDFGSQLVPHSLEAVAFDSVGRELARAEQRVNLPRPAAEASLALADYEDGRYRAAELAWRTVDETPPLEVTVSFDGVELPLTDRNRIRLPAHDPQRIHILSAELVFEGENRARTELAFGGQYGEAVSTELTAVAVDLIRGRRLPSLASLQGWFLVNGREARVVAVERGRAEVLAVRDRSSFRLLEKIGLAAGAQAGHSRSSAAAVLRNGLGRKDVLRYVHTTPRDVISERGTLVQVFPVSGNHNYHHLGGLAFALSHPHAEESALRDKQWLSTAVALAGLKAAASNRARAVLLILGGEVADEGGHSAASVRNFLRLMRVPLLVWRAGNDEVQPEWGEGQRIDELKDLNRSVRLVEKLLDPQIIVWLDGTHLPQLIDLAPAARDTLRFTGGS